MKTYARAVIAPLLISVCLFACNRSKEASPYLWQHETVNLDSTIANYPDTIVNNYVDSLKRIYNEKMDNVIGKCHHTIERGRPQGELSNLLTDIVFTIGDSISCASFSEHTDFAILNFGGIRKPLNAGNITIGDIYSILPFDNEIVLSSIRGSDLRLVIEQMSDSTNQPFANVSMIFPADGVPTHIVVNQAPLQDDKIYRFASIDFITNGGDNIFVQRSTQTKIPIGNIHKTNVLLRDAFIRYVQQTQIVQGYLDNRTH